MIHPRLLRRTALAAAVGLTGALLPVVLTMPPAQAADGPCLSEKPTGGSLLGGGTRCDDVNQPDTTITSATPTPTSGGYINSKSISIAFAGAYADADTDPISFECKFQDPTQAAASWSACTSPFSKSDLNDSKAGNYTFSVRALDSNDNAIDATSKPSGLGGSGATSDIPDLDESPATMSFRVDTVAPAVYILNVPFDADNPDKPLVYTQSPSFRLAASEANVALTCTIDTTDYPCQVGITTFADLPPGDHTLTVNGADPAGNTDPTPESVQFAVPENITTTSKAWTTLKQSTYVGGDYITTRTKGASVRVPADNYRDLRLLCSTGPKYGVVQLIFPSGKPVTIDLYRKKRTRHDIIVIQDRFSQLRTGGVTIKVISDNKPVILDGLLAH
ncbi:hypothetical protein GCM10022215_32380 [Nocardioides fonticola]|uniref:Ig-like domain-containing protein n=1 Tax=Nocardioides fonticola TaxID=450363 RepID=A0ABP7XSP8_9ACTN